ncbi:MAG: uracil-DNA glycosylase [Pirellulaceae bacterium]
MAETDLRQAAINYLRGLRDAGISDLPATAENRLHQLVLESAAEYEIASAPEPVPVAVQESPAEAHRSPPAAPHAPPASSGSLFKTGATDRFGPTLDRSARIVALQVLEQEVAACQRCEELARCRKQTVFGVGNPTPRLAFFGEGPGADEDRLGEPFVGRAGELLNKIIAACKMAREDVYIFNAVKCRPPGNRNPHDAELNFCREYWEQQLEILQPEFICCLGSVAARTLLNTTDSVGRMRGKFHKYRGSEVVVTYHPAYLLRTPTAKAKTWDDMKMLMDRMGIEY